MSGHRRALRRLLFHLAAEQAGYFSAAQARTLGYSYQAQSHHVRAGNWIRVDRGLFRLAEWIPDAHDELARWTLWSRGRAVVSHETALTVHGIGEFEAPRVHLTVPPQFTMHHDAVILHRAHLPDTDITSRTGFRVTTAMRSLIDIASVIADEEQLSRAVQDGLDTGLMTLRSLRANAEAIDPTAALRLERAISHQ